MFDDMEIDQTDSYTRLHADHIALMKEYGKLVGSHAAAVDLRKLAEKRIAELDNIIKRLYEDNISGKLTDERFIKLSGDFEREQDELNTLVGTLRRDITEREKKKTDARNFVAVTKKYTDLKELDATVLRECIERIYVYEKDKQTKTQEVEIVYNFIGAFDFAYAAEQQSKSKKSNGKAGTA